MFRFAFALIATLIYSDLAAAQSARLPLDAHVHFTYTNPESGYGQNQFLISDRVNFGFLISPSYWIWRNRELEEASPAWMADEKYIPFVNKKTSEFVESHADRFIGFCGLNLNWEEPLQLVQGCLEMPGMKGIKIHSEDANVSVVTPLFYARLDDVLSGIRQPHLVVLWHLMDDSEIPNAFHIAQNHPNVNFIFAHSMYAGHGLSEWRRLENGKPLANVWTEISANYFNTQKLLPPLLATEWQIFGVHRVLFGSDYGFMPDDEHANLIETIQNDRELSPKEKRQILYENGQRLLERLHLVPH